MLWSHNPHSPAATASVSAYHQATPLPPPGPPPTFLLVALHIQNGILVPGSADSASFSASSCVLPVPKA